MQIFLSLVGLFLLFASTLAGCGETKNKSVGISVKSADVEEQYTRGVSADATRLPSIVFYHQGDEGPEIILGNSINVPDGSEINIGVHVDRARQQKEYAIGLLEGFKGPFWVNNSRLLSGKLFASQGRIYTVTVVARHVAQCLEKDKDLGQVPSETLKRRSSVDATSADYSPGTGVRCNIADSLVDSQIDGGVDAEGGTLTINVL